MSGYHLMAVIPLLILFICSLIWFKKGLLHLTSLAYVVILTYVALTDTTQWEFMFFPLLMGTGFILILLFVYSMLEGDWL